MPDTTEICNGSYLIYCKYFEIFKSCNLVLDHLLILTQPSRLSSCALRSCKAFLLSGPLWKKRCRLKILRLSLPVRLSGMIRRAFSMGGLLFCRYMCLLSAVVNGRPTSFMGHHVKEENRWMKSKQLYAMYAKTMQYQYIRSDVAKSGG